MSDNFWPDGYVGGCLERTTEFGATCKAFAADDRVIWSDDECKALLENGQGRMMLPFIPMTFDQKSDGSCAWEALAGALQLSRAMSGQEFIRLNPLSGYAFTKVGRGKGGGGSSIDQNLQHARRHGLLPESIYPRSKGHMRSPSDELMDDEAPKHRIDEFLDIDHKWQAELRTALLSPFPVEFGLEGHAVYGCGLYDMDTVIYHNSWNGHKAPWGPWVCPELPDLTGFGLLPIRRINPAYGMFAVRSTTDAGTA